MIHDDFQFNIVNGRFRLSWVVHILWSTFSRVVHVLWSTFSFKVEHELLTCMLILACEIGVVYQSLLVE